MDTQTKKKKHLVLGHPILWCFLATPVAMFGSAAVASLLKALTGALLSSGDALNLINQIIDSGAYVLIALLLVKIAERSYGESFWNGAGLFNIKPSIILSLFGLIYVVDNLYMGIANHVPSTSGVVPVISIIIAAVGVGFAEELCARNFVIENAMQCWKDKPMGIWLTLGVSSFGFGALHLLNLTSPSNQPSVVFMQAFCAMALGVFFGAVYLRTRNLWGLVIMHALIDLIAFLFGDIDQVLGLTPLIATLDILMSVLAIAYGIYITRKSKWPEIQALWGIKANTTMSEGGFSDN